MRSRYTGRPDGTLVKTALVYTRDEHDIDPDSIDHDAIKVVRRLQSYGYESYVVGGAVRDLLLGRRPKDFDIATEATPNQIRKLFRNSRVIGRRFRLVHVLFRDKVIEVSTFRSSESEGFKNVFGTIEEDVQRRDFTANALYLNPLDLSIVDFVGGTKDIRARRLKPVIPIGRIFREDPVRMLRMLKYAAACNLKPVGALRRRVRRDRELLGDTPASRLTEELFKILAGGHSREIVAAMLRHRLMQYFLPEVQSTVDARSDYRARLLGRLGALDGQIAHSPSRAMMLSHLAGDYLLEYSAVAAIQRIRFREAYYALKAFLAPTTPPNAEVERAIELVFENKGRLVRDEAGTEPLRSRRRRPRRRRRRSSSEATPAGSAATRESE